MEVMRVPVSTPLSHLYSSVNRFRKPSIAPLTTRVERRSILTRLPRAPQMERTAATRVPGRFSLTGDNVRISMTRQNADRTFKNSRRANLPDIA